VGITKILDCPKPMVGRVIGKGGETIKTLQKQFGASIQIDQNSMPCKITVTGSQGAVESAVRAVTDLIQNPQGQMPYGQGKSTAPSADHVVPKNELK
jgi:far upstream element-binding protein